MAIENHGAIQNFKATQALAAHRFVSLGAEGYVDYPGAETEAVIGVTLEDVAAEDHVPVLMLNCAGKFKITAADSWSAPTAGAGTPLYTTTAGKASDSAGTKIRAYGLTAASGDGSIVTAIASNEHLETGS